MELGWIVHTISDHFPDDAQQIGDPEWVEYGLQRGWSLLTQDEPISTQAAVKAMLRKYRGCIHCLDSANLPVQVRADRFEAHRGMLTGYTVAGEVIEEEAATVRTLFSRFAAGDSLKGLAAWLTETGVPTRHGGRWIASTVQGILRNPRYAGRAVYQGQTTGSPERGPRW